tara:strand:+ start:11210 stop:11629 length:420 start_codon:yes stop_codon:yes gene_type:complete
MTKIIYQNSEGGVSIVVPTGEVPVEELPAKLGLTDYEIVADDAVPTDRTFRNAWVKSGKTIAEDLTKSKAIGHDLRRAKRAEEFAPHDDVISKQIPGADAEAAEASRATIRTKYATMQTSIDAASSTAEIKTALNGGAG